MVSTKLILICHYLGKFVTSDGATSYEGGEARVEEINPTTLYDNLKLKLAEKCNFNLHSLTVKYLFPGSQGTFITMTDDKDLEVMYGCHMSLPSAKIVVEGKGFRPKVLRRETGKGVADAMSIDSRSMRTFSSSEEADPSHSNSGSNADNPITAEKRRRNTSKKEKILAREGRKKAKARGRKENRVMIDDNDSDYSMDSRRGSISTKDLSHQETMACWKTSITGPEQEFESVYEFRVALQKYAKAHCFVYKLTKNDTHHAIGKCVSEGCSWRIFASRDQSHCFKIRSMNKTHTCSVESWDLNNWLVSVIKDKMLESPLHKPNQLHEILKYFGVKLKNQLVLDSINNATAELEDSYKEAYSQLPWLCKKLEEANPNGDLINLTINDKKQFHCLFLSFRASIDGFQSGCRPIIFLESTSLESKFHEILLTATALDGDDGFFPLGYAIVDHENDESWRLFLDQLKIAISTSRSTTFVSNQEKGLKSLVLEVFENAQHGLSMYHLSENLHKNSRGPVYDDGKSSLHINFVAAAHAVRTRHFTTHLEQIKRVCSQAYDWLMLVEPENWATSSFKGEPYNHITSDVAEMYKTWIREVSETPITHKIEVLRSKTMDLIIARRADSSLWSTVLTPSKEESLLNQVNRALHVKVYCRSYPRFFLSGDLHCAVNVEDNWCSCDLWKPAGLPCSHAIAVFKFEDLDVYSFCPDYYKATTYRLAYSGFTNPILETFKPENVESESVEILPPPQPRRRRRTW